MNWLSFAAVFVFSASLIEGVYILLLNPRSPVNRRFFGMAFCLSVWLLGAAFAYSGHDKEAVVRWFRICSFGFIFLHAFTLHFTLGLTGLFRRRISHLAAFLIYVPSILFLYKSATGLIVFKDFVPAGRLWLGIPDYDSLSFLLLMLDYITCYLLSAVLLLLWRKRTSERREKKQAVIILCSILFTIFLFNLEPFVLPRFTNHRTIAMSPIFGVFWIAGIGYAIMKYRLLTWSPSLLSSVILDDIDETVMVLDGRLILIYINRTGRELLGKTLPPAWGTADQKAGKPIGEVIINSGALLPDLGRLLSGEFSSFSCKLYLQGRHRAYMDMKCSAVRDSRGVFQGVAMVGREMKDSDSLKAEFTLSEKEEGVLRLLIQGKRISEISTQLGIAPRTVKAHSAHIYLKMNVRNKIELLRKLESFNLMPEHAAQSSAFPLLKKNPRK